MPDLIMGITGLNGTTDPMSALTNTVRRTGNTAGGEADDFGTVIDTTAMSIMAGSVLAPQATPMTLSNDVLGGSKDWGSVEITTRSIATRGNDYTQATAMSETERSTEFSTNNTFSEGLDTAVETAAEQMGEEAASRFGVSAEQVAEAMDLAGLTGTDLLTEDGLTDLVMAITGEDQAALITDDGLYGNLQGLIESADLLKADLTEQYGLTEETLEDAIELIGDRQIIEEGVRVGEETQMLTEALPEEEMTIAVPEDRHERMRRADDVQEAPGEDLMHAADNAQKDTQVRVSAGNESNTDSGTKAGTRSQGTQEETPAVQAEVAGTAGGFLNEVNEALAGAQTASYATGSETQTADIMRQMVESMRTSFQGDVTEMEMQLHPASLGRVNINLQAMDSGDVIARFTAQNEAVREALASQMPQLLERFEEQGIRVNEIQVTVEQHAFDGDRDRNMSREDAENEHEAAIGRMGRMRRVQIDLAGMDEEAIAALDEEDRIEAEMMAAEGNTVNYRA